MNGRLLDRWRQDLRAKVAAYSAPDSVIAPGGLPLPPPDYIRRLNSPEKAEPIVFLRSGASDLLAIVEAIADAVQPSMPGGDAPVQGRPAIMELGCGVGRLLRHAPPAALARVVATDVDVQSLDWCRAHLPAAEYHLHRIVPPIASLPAMTFDIIYAHSVFTHIPLERQTAWLEEMRRLLRPGGVLAATFLGSAQKDAVLSPDERATLLADGAIQIIPNGSRDAPTAYGAVCQTTAHQEMRVGAVLEFCLRKERHGRQDVVVARRPPLPG
jgi:SAM-dependent methyltransferase